MKIETCRHVRNRFFAWGFLLLALPATVTFLAAAGATLRPLFTEVVPVCSPEDLLKVSINDPTLTTLSSR